jgi:hypothetical protein
MSNLIPGLSEDQSDAVEFALRMVPAQLADGISAAINAGLGNTGGPYSDQQVMSSIVISLIRCSGLELPNTLFESDIGVKADALQIHSATAGLSGAANLKH